MFRTTSLPLLLLLVATSSSCYGELTETADHHGPVEEEDIGSIDIRNKRVGDFETSTCSTAIVAPLSRQIAEEMLCMAPEVLVELEPGNGLTFRSSAVLPFMEATAAKHLRNAAAERPIELTSGFRTVVQQYLLRRWYERGRCGIRAAARPGRSNHETGRAIDVANRSAVRSTLRNHSWRDPLPGDPVHFEHLSSPDLRGLDVHAFQRLWNRNNANDRIDEDGQYGPGTAARIKKAPAAGFPIGPQCSGGGTGTDSANWIGDTCQADAGCDLPVASGRCEVWVDSDTNQLHGMCVSDCNGICPDRGGEIGTFCAALAANQGTCLPLADASSDFCDAIPGAEPVPMRRFSGAGTTSSTVATVCVAPQVPGIECKPSGATGECIDTNTTTCSGQLFTGACPGPTNIRCCTD